MRYNKIGDYIKTEIKPKLKVFWSEVKERKPSLIICQLANQILWWVMLFILADYLIQFKDWSTDKAASMIVVAIFFIVGHFSKNISGDIVSGNFLYKFNLKPSIKIYFSLLLLDLGILLIPKWFIKKNE